MTSDFPAGNYRFIPAVFQYSGGVAANPGYEIERVRFDKWVPLAEGFALTITREPARGVVVDYDGENIDIDIYVIVEYGTRITTVADSVASTVRYHVETAIGMPVHQVNVHVAGLRISDAD